MVGMPIAISPSGRILGTISGSENSGTSPNVPDEISAKNIPLKFFMAVFLNPFEFHKDIRYTR